MTPDRRLATSLHLSLGCPASCRAFLYGVTAAPSSVVPASAPTSDDFCSKSRRAKAPTVRAFEYQLRITLHFGVQSSCFRVLIHARIRAFEYELMCTFVLSDINSDASSCFRVSIHDARSESSDVDSSVIRKSSGASIPTPLSTLLRAPLRGPLPSAGRSTEQSRATPGGG